MGKLDKKGHQTKWNFVKFFWCDNSIAAMMRMLLFLGVVWCGIVLSETLVQNKMSDTYQHIVKATMAEY